MRHPTPFLVALLFLSRSVMAQTPGPAEPSPDTPKPAHPPAAAPSNSHPSTPAPPAAGLQGTIDHLTQSNQELLDLLKKQQAVLEDIQYDRRLQSRQIQSLEERLEETLLQNAQLQNKISSLEADAAVAPTPVKPANPTNAPPAAVEPPAPPPPSTYLPPAPIPEAPGAPSWHRLFTLSGTDNKNSDFFRIQGSTWRVFWHNLDKPGKGYQNTSALFINAFPKDDTIPQKVCSKLGTGGECAQLLGPGNYYLKIEASGGSWELAIEDFH